MAGPTPAQLATARSLLRRAEVRFEGAAVAAHRAEPSPGEFDNNFDGVVSGIFHIVDAFELATSDLRRAVREGEQSTRILSVVTELQRDGTSPVPASARLINLNSRRNTSVHGEWIEVLDTEALEEALVAGNELLAAVRAYLRKKNVEV